MKLPRLAPITGWRVAAFAAVAVFLALIARYYHPVYRFTSLLQLDAPNDTLKLQVFHELPVYVHRDTGGYDGLYYAQIAYHPLLDSPDLPRAIDNVSYRARRMLPATLAWGLAAGQREWIVHVYSVLNIAAWLAFAWLLWRLLAVRETRGWIAWAGFLFSAGALASVRLALTDLIAALFIAISFGLAERGRAKSGTAALAAAVLSRETAVLGLAGLAERPWLSWRNVARGICLVAPLALWMLYILWRVGPMNQGVANLTFPVVGYVEKWVEAVYAFAWLRDWPLVWGNVLCLVGLTVQALYFLLRRELDDRWWRLGVAYTALMLCLGTAVWEDYPGAAPRLLLPLTLAFNVFAARRRAPIAVLLAGNLTVLAGLGVLRDAPAHAKELAALNRGPHDCIATVQEGWFGREQLGRHLWYWTRQRGTVRLDTWPQTPARVRFAFELRGLDARTIVLRQDGREILRADITPNFSKHAVVLEIPHGHTVLEFASDRPGAREGGMPGARELAFGLFDPKLEPVER